MRKSIGARGTPRRFLVVLLLTLGLGVIPLTFNALVDPLWYFEGNQFGPNYPFNERVSKANLFAREQGDIDCLILGSSRTTLFDARKIKDARCFNYAVSQADLEDSLGIARYVRKRGATIKRIVVALDAFMLSEARAKSVPLPDFYASGKSTPNGVLSYLSIDAWELSRRALNHDAPNDREYDDDFVARAIPGSGPYISPPELTVPAELGRDSEFNQFSLGPFSLPTEVEQLVALFPQAKKIAYVPPVSADYVGRLKLAGTLDSYLTALNESREHFDEIYDFSIPSFVNKDPANTYDGSHYYKRVNDRVGAILSGRAVIFGIAVHETTSAQFINTYQRRVDEYLAEKSNASR